ncbi:MAG: hypothetical protein AAB209_02810 [Bacteroidota bacterium]
MLAKKAKLFLPQRTQVHQGFTKKNLVKLGVNFVTLWLKFFSFGCGSAALGRSNGEGNREASVGSARVDDNSVP